MGTKWCCSGFREPESKVYADPEDFSSLTDDVRQFVEESSLDLAVGAEMEPVADTFRFRGVESLNGVYNWEGQPDGLEKPQNEWRHQKHVENHEKDHTTRASHADSEWVHSSVNLKQSEPQRKQFLSFFWKFLPQKTCSKNAVELTEFA